MDRNLGLTLIARLGMRTIVQIAKPAIVMTSLAFRASLEVTDHSRAKKASDRIPGWLGEQGVNDELDAIERDILETPYRQLEDRQRRDANWSGEGAWIMAWALKLVELPPNRETVDPRILVERLGILRQDVTELTATVSLKTAP